MFSQGISAGTATCRDSEIVTADGKRRFFRVNVYPLVRADGKSEGSIVVFTDETEKERLQEQVHRQSKLHALGQMVAGAAHEIRNPLSAIKNFTDLLPKKYHVPSFREEFLRHVPAEVERLDRLVSDLLSFSARKPPEPEELYVRDLTESAVALCGARAREKQAKLGIHVGKETVYADADQMKQVLINVILNSIEWIDKGGRVDIHSSSHDGLVTVAVSDNGRGIPSDLIADVFDPFFTLRRGGSGLGLTLSYQYVADNNGTMDIESIPGEGTRVCITLPRSPAPAESME